MDVIGERVVKVDVLMCVGMQTVMFDLGHFYFELWRDASLERILFKGHGPRPKGMAKGLAQMGPLVLSATKQLMLQLTAALKLMGDGPRAGQALAAGLSRKRDGERWMADYGSPLRDQALILSVLENVVTETRFFKYDAAAGSFQLARIRRLVVVHRAGKGDQDGGASRCGQFGDAGGAGAADHKVAFGEPVGHVVEEGADFGVDADFAIASLQHIHLFGAALLGDLQTRAQRRTNLCQRIGNDGCEHGRAKRSADNRQLQRLAIRVRQLVDLEECRADRHAGNEMDDLVGKIARAFPAQSEMAAPACQQMVGTSEMGILFMQHGRNASQARGQHRRKGRIAAEPDHRGN